MNEKMGLSQFKNYLLVEYFLSISTKGIEGESIDKYIRKKSDSNKKNDSSPYFVKMV